jgi:2-(1,2-epoxy-1,2-dihydrophenyl)acetyl-CoA isomerase
VSPELEPTAPDGAPVELPLLRERDGRVLILTLNRPERLNALTRELHRQLHEAVLDASRDSEIGAVVLTGAGRAFCSGGDLGDRKHSAAAPPTVEQRADELLQHSETARLLHEMPKPTLAMINGVAAGSGLSLALACDFRLASRSAVLTTAYAKVALSGDLGVSYFLTHLVGAARARELLFLSDKIDAAEAHRLGLVNRLAEDADLRESTLQFARALANGPSVAFRYMKRNLVLARNGSLREVLESEAYGMARCGRTQDVKEAALAFRDKRAPVFKGC